MENTRAGSVSLGDQLAAIRSLVPEAPASKDGKEETDGEADLETQTNGSVHILQTDPEVNVGIKMNTPPPQRHQVPPLHLVSDEDADSFAQGIKDEIHKFRAGSERPRKTPPREEVEEDPEDLELEHRLRQSEIERNKAQAREAKASAFLQAGVGAAVFTLSASALVMVWKSIRGGR